MEDQVNEVVENENQEMGVITAIRYGITDQGIGLAYAVKIIKGDVGMFMPVDKVNELITKYNISDLNALTKQPCIVKVEDNTVTFIRLA